MECMLQKAMQDWTASDKKKYAVTYDCSCPSIKSGRRHSEMPSPFWGSDCCQRIIPSDQRHVESARNRTAQKHNVLEIPFAVIVHIRDT